MPGSVPFGFKALPLAIGQLSLAAVLKCGQSFRWSAFPLLSPDVPQTTNTPAHEYRFCLRDRVVCLRQSPDTLFYRTFFSQHYETSPMRGSSSCAEKRDAETLAFIQDYFQLDLDLLKLYDEWSDCDPVFRNLRARFSGIRMLRQDPWECLISFICSSNNNISRISKMVQNLCTHFSPPVITLDGPESVVSGASETAPCTYYAFPPPSVLAAPSVSAKLRNLGFGYRADFIQKTAAMLVEEHGSDEEVFKFLAGLRKMSTDDARTELLKLMGVGRKVADCILLMSLDKREVVPVDTHVYQIAVKHYGMRGSSGGKTPMTPKLYSEVNTRLAGIWGEFAGWAHSILFTADLKSFSSFGLPTPSPSASPEKSISHKTEVLTTPSPSPTKKRKSRQLAQEPAIAPLLLSKQCEIKIEDSLLEGNLAERVKKRRRILIAKSEGASDW